MKTTMNSSGYVIETRGIIPEIVDWLAQRFHSRSVNLKKSLHILKGAINYQIHVKSPHLTFYSYSYVSSSANLLVDDDSKRRGKFGFLKSGVTLNTIRSVKI